MVESKTLGEIAVVDSQIDEACQEIGDVHHHQIEDGSRQGGKQPESSDVYYIIPHFSFLISHSSFLVSNDFKSSVVAWRMALPMRSNRWLCELSALISFEAPRS